MNTKLIGATLICCGLTLFTACGETKEETNTTPSSSPSTNENTPASTESNSDNFESKLLECNLPEGETLTLTNRNDHIDYIVDCRYSVLGHLNIEKNVTIQFQTDAGFDISGKGYLKAIGTESAPVRFTGVDQTEGSWRGLFYNSNHVNNELTHTIIEYAGGEAFNSNGDKGSIIVYAGAKLKANNNLLRHGKVYGVNISYGEADVALHDNTIESHKAPMSIQGQYVDKIVGGKYTSNTTDAILINNYLSSIESSSRWRDLGVPYHILDNLRVEPAGKMIVDPGVTLAFAPNTQLSVKQSPFKEEPSLIAVGTGIDPLSDSTSDSVNAKPIIFTGINKVKGAWRGIYFDSANVLNEIGFARIEYASSSNQKGAIEAWAETVLFVHDVEFKEIQNCAIYGDGQGYLDSVRTSNLTYTNTGGEICEN